MSDEEKHGSRCKLDGCPSCMLESRTLEEALSEIYVLWIRSRGSGNLIAWWYHPNREALEEKQALLEADGLHVVLHRFVRGGSSELDVVVRGGSSELDVVFQACRRLIERWTPSELIDPVDHAWKRAAEELAASIDSWGGRPDRTPDLSDPDVGRAFNAIGSLKLGLFYGRRARLAQLIVDEARRQTALHSQDDEP